MAERRMFNKQITRSDAFLDMPQSSRLLYYDLSLDADDDGFIGNYKSIMRLTGASEDDLKLLIAKTFIIPFEKGIVVIKHWKINNIIRSDRYKPTVYQDEKSKLTLKENGVYTIVETVGIPTDNQLTPQLGKDSIGKFSLIDKYKNNNMQDTRTREDWVSFLVSHFKEFFKFHPNDKFTQLANEIIETLAKAIVQSDSQDQLKFNNKTYDKKTFIENVISNINEINLESVIKGIAFKEDIKNRPHYILSCVINEAEQKVVKVGAK